MSASNARRVFIFLIALLIAGPTNAIELNPYDAIVVVGDSLSNGGPHRVWPDILKQHTEGTLYNLAAPGRTAEIWAAHRKDFGIYFLDDPYVREYAIIWLGTNDLIAGRAPRDTVSLILFLATNLRAAGADRVAIVLGPEPFIPLHSLIHELNEIQEWACTVEAFDVDCIDLHGMTGTALFEADGLHLSQRGHRRVMRRVRDFLEGW